jgi:signal transduction histidine kinase
MARRWWPRRWPRRSPRLWPRGLAGQLIVLLLGALIVAQLVTAAVLIDEQRLALRDAERDRVLTRTASIVRLIEETPPSLHARILAAAATPRFRFAIAAAPLVDAVARTGRFEARLTGLLQRRLGDGRSVRVRLDAAEGFFSDRDRWRPPKLGHHDEAGDDREHMRRAPPRMLVVSVPLAAGSWLNVESTLPPALPSIAWLPLLTTLLMALAILAIVALTVRRLTRPLRALADAAERFGRGESVPPLPAAGPIEVRRTTGAFNAMQERLGRFIADRTRLLAAISHDLRTPITSLRLRAEFIDDAETRAKMIETLDELSRMAEATLAFARDDAAAEPTRPVDLAALLQSLADDLADLGQDVVFADAPALPYPCRPVALKRALRNLIENAVRYGGGARVALAATADGPRIAIEDDGPGIDPARLGDVFEPFVRLETSRSRDTGGVGLGLAIARSIVRAHGGELTLANRVGPDGAVAGLAATVALPPA